MAGLIAVVLFFCINASIATGKLKFCFGLRDLSLISSRAIKMGAPPPFLTLRPADVADCDAIADIWHAGASLPNVGPPVMPSRRDLRQRVDIEFRGGWSVTLAIRRESVVGFIALKPAEAVLDQLFVHPDSIGGGVGKALFAHAKATMPNGFTLFTRPANIRACRFYERGGMSFLRKGRHPRTGDPIVHYVWSSA